MPFGIPKEGFWGKKELSYQHVHMFYGFWLAYFSYFVFPIIWAFPIIGCCAGLLMESYQYRKYIESGTIPRTWMDSIRDFCFWVIGSCLNYIVYFVRW